MQTNGNGGSPTSGTKFSAAKNTINIQQQTPLARPWIYLCVNMHACTVHGVRCKWYEFYYFRAPSIMRTARTWKINFTFNTLTLYFVARRNGNVMKSTRRWSFSEIFPFRIIFKPKKGNKPWNVPTCVWLMMFSQLALRYEIPLLCTVQRQSQRFDSLTTGLCWVVF